MFKRWRHWNSGPGAHISCVSLKVYLLYLRFVNKMAVSCIITMRLNTAFKFVVHLTLKFILITLLYLKYANALFSFGRLWGLTNFIYGGYFTHLTSTRIKRLFTGIDINGFYLRWRNALNRIKLIFLITGTWFSNAPVMTYLS